MEDHNILYLSRSDVESTGVEISVIIEAVENAFLEKGRGKTEAPPKPGLHPKPDAIIHAMPAYIPALKSMGIKWISGYPGNPEKGLPQIAGLIILNDPETGLPLAIMDATWITAQRTAAATAVSAKYLARSGSETLGILGAGVQGFSHFEAMKTLFPIKKVIVYDIHPEQTDIYERKVKDAWPGMAVIKAKEPRQAVEGSDIIVTAGPITKTPHATIQAGWLSEGAFASLVDFDSYWSREAMCDADKFTTDDIPQLKYYRKIGYFQNIPSIYADLGELVSEKKKGRENEREKTIACNLGLAIEDVATAKIIYQQAKKKDIGIKLPV